MSGMNIATQLITIWYKFIFGINFLCLKFCFWDVQNNLYIAHVLTPKIWQKYTKASC